MLQSWDNLHLQKSSRAMWDLINQNWEICVASFLYFHFSFPACRKGGHNKLCLGLDWRKQIPADSHFVKGDFCSGALKTRVFVAEQNCGTIWASSIYLYLSSITVHCHRRWHGDREPNWQQSHEPRWQVESTGQRIPKRGLLLRKFIMLLHLK